MLCDETDFRVKLWYSLFRLVLSLAELRLSDCLLLVCTELSGFLYVMGPK